MKRLVFYFRLFDFFYRVHIDMYRVYGRRIPKDILELINDLNIDRQQYKYQYDKVVRELLWIQIHKYIRTRIQRIN